MKENFMAYSKKENLAIVLMNLYAYIFFAPTVWGFFSLCSNLFPFDKYHIIFGILLLVAAWGIIFSFNFPYLFVSIPLALCLAGISTFGLNALFKLGKITIEDPLLTIILIIYFMIFSICTVFVHKAIGDMY